MRGAWKAVLVAALVLLPSIALAQGTLAGTVKDQSGAALPGVTVTPPQTNIVFAQVSDGRTPALLEHLKSRGVLATGLIGLRFVTHLDVDAAGVDHAIAAAREFLEA